jgi:zinc D-Ala-D-Ala dipeptidase
MTGALVALALLPAQFVALDRIDPTIQQDMRYATRHNFVGRRIHGYRDPVCILTRPAARALHRAQRRLGRDGYGLRVYDCYRPTRAVDQFARWAANAADQKMKREFYPHVDKSRAFELGYIAHRSGHSRGSAVDLTLVRRPAKPPRAWDGRLRPCAAPYRKRFRDGSLNMGTTYDCIDPRAHTFDARISGRPHRNRLRLRDAMNHAGFAPYDNEWWHFTLRGEPYPEKYFNFPVARESVR